MTDDYTRQGQIFRAEDFAGIIFPVILAGAHVRTYVGTQSIASTSSSQSLTVPSGATFADIYCDSSTDTDYVRYWHNSTTPTASVGVKLKAHEVVQSADPASFRFIAGAGTPTLRVEYYKYA